MKEKIFCDLCGRILNVQKIGEKKFAFCSCGFIKEIHRDIIGTEIETKQKEIGEGIVIAKETKMGFPHKCKKCGFPYCEIYDLGASYSDEANIYLYQCKECGFVERQADGSSNR